MTLLEYSQLKQEIMLSVNKNDKHSEILNSLKEIFKDNINSVRRLEQINSVGQLLNVLEYRDVLSDDNVAPLKDIVRKLSNGVELLRRISEYEEFQIPTKITNFSDFKNVSTKETPSYSPLNNHPITGNISPIKRHRIFETITEELGTYWRNVARFLNIRECTIIGIDNQNICLPNKVLKILEIYEQRADPQRWFFTLCDALEKAHRKDIADTLRNIMAMNI